MDPNVILEDARLRVHAVPLPGVLVLEPKVFRDRRDFFLETFRQSWACELPDDNRLQVP